jgi:hypothetical protein
MGPDNDSLAGGIFVFICYCAIDCEIICMTYRPLNCVSGTDEGAEIACPGIGQFRSGCGGREGGYFINPDHCVVRHKTGEFEST